MHMTCPNRLERSGDRMILMTCSLRAPQVTKVVMGSSEDLVSDHHQCAQMGSTEFHTEFHLFHFWFVPLSRHFWFQFTNETCKKELTVGWCWMMLDALPPKKPTDFGSTTNRSKLDTAPCLHLEVRGLVALNWPQIANKTNRSDPLPVAIAAFEGQTLHLPQVNIPVVGCLSFRSCKCSKFSPRFRRISASLGRWGSSCPFFKAQPWSKASMAYFLVIRSSSNWRISCVCTLYIYIFIHLFIYLCMYLSIYYLLHNTT